MRQKKSKPIFVITRRWVVGAVLMMSLLFGLAYVVARGLRGQEAVSQLPLTTTQQQPDAHVISASDTVVSQGVAVTYAAQPDPAQTGLTEVSFTLTDASSGQPVTSSSPPSVWISAQQAQAGAQSQEALGCDDRIKLYIQGTFDSRPEIDLNSYYILALNNDASISVIDPLGGVTGISQLYAMVFLESSGEDWATSADGKRLFVTMPQVGQVAVVDTDSFKVLTNIDVGPNPVRIALQPDGRYLWVGNDSPGITSSQVTVIDTATLKVAARIAVGPGQHAIAFSGKVDDIHHQTESAIPNQTSYAFIANSQAGTVSVVDTQSLQKHEDVPVDIQPTSLDFSSASNAVYVASATENTVVVIDAANQEVVGSINAAQSTQAIRFAPGGRWGFAVSPASNNVIVIDATTNRVVHSVKVDGAPDKVSFTTAYAYVHDSQKAEVALFDLAQVGRADPLSPVNIIGGQTSPDQASALLSVADAIIPVHEHGNHVLIANPGDQSIYYYMEGMNAPMGTFQNYSRTPRAVRVVDRSLHETTPGVYTARIKIPKSGQYQVAFLLESPRIVHCFAFTAESDSAAADNNGEKSLTLQFLSEAREIQAGAKFTLKFALADAVTHASVSDITDVTILATLASGQRNERFQAESIGNGIYEAELILPVEGFYNVYLTIPSRQIDVGGLPSLTLHVTPGTDTK